MLLDTKAFKPNNFNEHKKLLIEKYKDLKLKVNETRDEKTILVGSHSQMNVKLESKKALKYDEKKTFSENLKEGWEVVEWSIMPEWSQES